MRFTSERQVQNLKRVRYVTGNYERLQGLRAVAVGVVLVLFGVMLSVGLLNGFPELRVFQILFQVTGVILAILMIVLPVWVGSYYERRFGRVRSRWKGLSRYEVIGMLLVLAFVYGLLAANQFYGEGMEQFLSGVAPGVYFGGLLVYEWWPKRSRFTAYWPVLAAVVAGSGPLLSLAGQISGWQLLLPMIAILGVASIIGGLLDHLLLVSTMKSLPAESLDAVR